MYGCIWILGIYVHSNQNKWFNDRNSWFNICLSAASILKILFSKLIFLENTEKQNCYFDNKENEAFIDLSLNKNSVAYI